MLVFTYLPVFPLKIDLLPVIKMVFSKLKVQLNLPGKLAARHLSETERIRARSLFISF